jgi:type II secretory pathway component PulK
VIQIDSNMPVKRRRPAAILVVLIVVMTIVITLFGLWARQAVSEQRRIEMQAYRLQAVRLAEAGVQRLLATRAITSANRTESWSIPAESLDGRHTAIVKFQIISETDGESTKYVATATAEYPAESLRREVVTRSVSVPVPNSTDAP